MNSHMQRRDDFGKNIGHEKRRCEKMPARADHVPPDTARHSANGSWKQQGKRDNEQTICDGDQEDLIRQDSL